MKNKQRKELAVCGIAAVKALAAVHPQRIQRFYFDSSRTHEFGKLCRYLSQNRKPYNLVQSEELEKLCGSIHHQGAVAMVEPPHILPLNKSTAQNWTDTNDCAVIMDGVGNANNLGAIVRSAVFFGIHNIVLPADEAANMVTTSSYRVAQGGMEHVNLYSINSIPAFLKDIKGKIVSIGTDLQAQEPVRVIHAAVAGKPFVIVLGNEENGISKAVANECDHCVLIPGCTDSIQSLNVAQAASVVFYALRNG